MGNDGGSFSLQRVRISETLAPSVALNKFAAAFYRVNGAVNHLLAVGDVYFKFPANCENPLRICFLCQ